ncbi:MAG: hypothetical protein M0Q45_04590 [Bacteroidales bacterium]|nr:hypothetical protein [Bacteroidales bacterium]
MKRYFLIFNLLLSSLIYAQIYENSFPEYKGNYFGMDLGFSSGLVRDLLTSPLFYTSSLAYVDFNYLHISEKNIFEGKFANHSGINSKFINDNFYIGFQTSFDFKFSWLKYLQTSSDESFKNYLGLDVDNYSIIRINPEFMNAASSIDNISNFAIVYQAKYNYHRLEKEKKFLGLIKYKRKEKFYVFSGKLSVPIISMYYRPSFTNPGNATLIENAVFNAYSLKAKAFSGLNTELAVFRVLPNGNMFKYAYSWMFATNGKNAFNRLEFSHHIFSLGFVFKIN